MQRIRPAPGQESVWDYPRPPKLELSNRRVRIRFGGIRVADSNTCYRVLETSHPPTWYLPPAAVHTDLLVAVSGNSCCEFKGRASYWTLRVNGQESTAAAWSYPEPTKPFAALRDYLAFYPFRVEACFLDEERVKAQPGDFYGGWITSEIVGPFKGGADTLGW